MNATATINAWIVDDEPLARLGLALMLKAEPDFCVLGESIDGASALAALSNPAIDVVFMDIQMPDMSGMAVVDKLGPNLSARLIFVTAYDEYAVAAFEKNAIDYVLKPVDPARFQLTLNRVRTAFKAGPGTNASDAAQLLAVVRQMLQAPPQAPVGVTSPQRIAVQSGGQTQLLDLDAVDYFESDGHYTWAYVAKQRHLATVNLSALEARLDSPRFLRIHRSLVLNLNLVRSVKIKPHGEYQFSFASGATVAGARSYSAQIREALKKVVI